MAKHPAVLDRVGLVSQGGFDMEVVELVPGRRVRWRVVDGPPEWLGTIVDRQRAQHDGFTIVRFTQEGFAEPDEFLHHCSTTWAVYLLSLKALVETGAGAPSPRDLAISDWY